MESAMKLDTLAFSKRLRDAGADQKLAEAIVEGLAEADTSELASKADVAAVKADVAEVRTELSAEIAEVRTDLAVFKSEITAELATVQSKLTADIATVRGEITTVRGEITTLKGELARDLWQASNRSIIAFGGIVGVLFVVDRLLSLF